MKARSQLGLFDRASYAIDASFGTVTRTLLADGAWFDYGQGFLTGHEALLQELTERVRFHEESRVMYERTVAVPRLVASLPADGPVLPVLECARQAISARYDEQFTRLSLGYYRGGRDSVAWHGDYVARKLPRATVATISLGAPRPFYGCDRYPACRHTTNDRPTPRPAGGGAPPAGGAS